MPRVEIVHRVARDPVNRPLPPLRYGEQDRVLPGGECPRIAMFRAWSGENVSRSTNGTPPWLHKWRAREACSHPRAGKK
jgi:hypothetical protein